MKRVFEMKEHRITMHQYGRDAFKVQYGFQVYDRMDYGLAAARLGECIMHALSADGVIDSRAKGEK